jgi:hypothetical protein
MIFLTLLLMALMCLCARKAHYAKTNAAFLIWFLMTTCGGFLTIVTIPGCVKGAIQVGPDSFYKENDNERDQLVEREEDLHRRGTSQPAGFDWEFGRFGE